MDAVASFLMDCGVDPGDAIEAAAKLLSAGFANAGAIRGAEPAALSVASDLSDDHVQRVLSHRHPEVPPNPNPNPNSNDHVQHVLFHYHLKVS